MIKNCNLIADLFFVSFPYQRLLRCQTIVLFWLDFIIYCYLLLFILINNYFIFIQINLNAVITARVSYSAKKTHIFLLFTLSIK